MARRREKKPLKKRLLVLPVAALLMQVGCSAAASPKGPTYTMPTKGTTVLQNMEDRMVPYNPADLAASPVISGESPITGLPLPEGQPFLPMLISMGLDSGKVEYNGKTVAGVGLGKKAPWGAQYTDIIYETRFFYSGYSRLTFLFSDSFAQGQPTGVGPVRSSRIAQMLPAEEGRYQLFSGAAPMMTFPSAYQREESAMLPMLFSNVIVRRVSYTFDPLLENYKAKPFMECVGQGNADIFIGGRYIPGYWVKKSYEAPTVWFDDQGNRLRLARGKTYIAHFPPEALLTYGEE